MISSVMPASFGVQGPGEDHDAIGRQRLDLSTRQLVVAHHLHLRTQLAQVLHQVVGERIVVVDHQ